MHSILKRNTFFVKEHIGMFKAANNYDILDPDSQEIILHCREEKLNFFTKLARFSDYKTMTPFDIEVKTPEGELVLEVKRGFTFFRSKVEVLNENGKLVGYLRQRMLSIGGKFDVMDAKENVLCTLKGNWTSWNFKFARDKEEYAHISKQWAGFGKELFTDADNYGIEIFDNVPQDSPLRILILGAVLCIDMVLKEDS